MDLALELMHAGQVQKMNLLIRVSKSVTGPVQKITPVAIKMKTSASKLEATRVTVLVAATTVRTEK
jgi:hypothetical protein